MAFVPEFYSRAADHHGASPEIFRRLQERTTNLASWQQNPVTDYSPELKHYLQRLRDDQPENTGEYIPQEIAFKNGETLIFSFDKAIIQPGFETLVGKIQELGNAISDHAGLPVTFFPKVEQGKGLSSLRYLSPAAIKERIARPQEDDFFHMDGQFGDEPQFGGVPIVTKDTPEHPSFATTIITDFVGARRTWVVKGEFAERVAQEAVRQLQKYGPDQLTLTRAIEEVAQRTGQTVHRNFEPGEVGAFAIMPYGVRGRSLFDSEPTRVFGLHRSPSLQEGDDPRLTLVLRAQIGGFKPK